MSYLLSRGIFKSGRMSKIIILLSSKCTLSSLPGSSRIFFQKMEQTQTTCIFQNKEPHDKIAGAPPITERQVDEEIWKNISKTDIQNLASTMRKPDGNNNNNKPLGQAKDDNSAPSEVTTCASTVNTNLPTLEEQRNLLQARTVQLGVAAGTTVTAITLAYIPMQLLAALGMIIALLAGMFYTLYQRAQLEFENIVTGRGVGDYLPQDVYDQLVNVSFHDSMVNGNSPPFEEYQYFLLYLIPGITTEQLNAYVDRLRPRHQRILHRPGLGHFLGHQFMRLVMGDSRLAEQQRASGLVPRRLELTESGATGDRDDDASGLGMDEDPASQYVRPLRIEPVSDAPATSRAGTIVDASNADGDHDDEDEDEEEDVDYTGVIVEAVFNGARTVSGMASTLALSYARNTVSWAAGGPARAPLTLGAAGIAMGILGLWTGAFELPSNFQMPRMSTQSRSALMSSSIASAATASMMLMMFGVPGGKSDEKKKK